MDDQGSVEFDKRSASKRLADRLRSKIEDGTYPPGSQLPSYRQLAAEWGIVVNTAQQAVRLVEREGLVAIRHGSGAFVLEPTERLPAEARLHALRTELEELRGQLRTATQGLGDVERRLAELTEQLNAPEK